MMASKKPMWPPTISPVLSAFRAAMDRRSKALRHHLFGWTCERFEPEDDSGESWLVVFNLVKAEVRVRLWADGVVWLYIRDGGRNDWRFELGFYGRIDAVEPDEMIEDLETTFLLACQRPSNESAKQSILDRWRRYEPYDVNPGRA